MLLPFGCPVCNAMLFDAGVPLDAAAWAMVPRVAVSDTVSLVKCSRGHESVFIVQDGAFALLFERGVRRYALEGYRDAILDAYTALEMYLSHVPVIAAFNASADPKPQPSDLRKMLGGNDLFMSTERCWGAAMVLFHAATGQKPPLPDGDVTKHRNRAVHLGRYPSQSDALAVLKYVSRTITAFAEAVDPAPPVKTSETVFARYWLRVAHEEVSRVAAERKKRGQPALLTTTGALGTLLAGRRPDDLDARIQAYRSGRRGVD